MQKLELYYEFMIGAINGLYGWFYEIIALIIFVVVFNFFAKTVLLKLDQHFKRQKRVFEECFVKALYVPFSSYIRFFAIIHLFDMVAVRYLQDVQLPNVDLILAVGAVLALAWFLLRWKNFIIHDLSSKFKVQATALDLKKIDLIDKFLTVVIIFFAVLIVLEITDRNLQTIIAFGGIGGLAIAFASQEVISNFFSGIMIYVSQPFSRGEWIHIPDKGVEGTVEEIGWYMTRIRSLDKKPIYIPNAIFSKAIVITPSRMTHRLINETLHLRYQDIKVLKLIMQNIRLFLQEHPAIDAALGINVFFNGFNNAALNLTIIANCALTAGEDFNKAKDEILFKIYDIINDHQAELAYPARTLYLPEELKAQSRN